MKDEISALMDGELDGNQASQVIAKLGQSEEHQSDWWIYHLIGDALRNTVDFPSDLTDRIRRRLATEPTVLAPRSFASQSAKVFALSAAASVAAIVMVAWIMLKGGAEGTQPLLAAKEAPEAVQMVSLPLSDAMGEYLIAHQEYSPTTQIQGMAPFVRTVADSRQDGSR